jgi:hypothetical protein
LLHRLAGREAKEWAGEEDLAAGQLDVTDLKKRLAGDLRQPGALTRMRGPNSGGTYL